MIAILSVTSEWSQRSGLTTFTLVPHRGRVIRAKLAVTVLVGVASMVVALGDRRARQRRRHRDRRRRHRLGPLPRQAMRLIVLANVIGMMVGFMLGVLIRNSAGAIVGYFVYWFVLPTLSMCSPPTSSGSTTCSRGWI